MSSCSSTAQRSLLDFHSQHWTLPPSPAPLKELFAAKKQAKSAALLAEGEALLINVEIDASMSAHGDGASSGGNASGALAIRSQEGSGGEPEIAGEQQEALKTGCARSKKKSKKG